MLRRLVDWSREWSAGVALLAATLLLLAGAALASGCEVDTLGIDYDWQRAERIAWEDAPYAQTIRRPFTELVRDERLNCHGGWGFRDWMEPGDERCLAGMTDGENWRVWIAAPYFLKPSASALCHEYWHLVLWQTGDVDDLHLGPGWRPGGEVDQCKANLRGRGLEVLP